ncbi:MAG TPA: cation:proton antiporter [Vicinamibacterales bacterium]|nr:cation:proton antiporter [Vicinamibacterales bacterium]
MLDQIPRDVAYLGLLFGLFVVPRFLQRYHIPTAVTALSFGAVAGMGFGFLADDPTVGVVSTLGIVALFLFAGLDVRVEELRRERRVLIEHVVLRLAALGLAMFVIAWVLNLGPRASALIALALLTPSTGFILDSLNRWGLSKDEQFWIRSKAIATELVALAVLFVVLQSTDSARLSLSALVIVAMIAILPAFFRWLARAVIPYAPNSEFGFLLMVAAACAIITRQLGVYYLVGAFAVGMAAQEFRRKLSVVASERMFGAVEAFAALFVPFYFFHAGLGLEREDVALPALGLGLAFTLLTIPFRLGLTVLHRRWRLRETLQQSLRVGVPMLPTTVFTLVIAEILQQRYGISPTVFGGLIVYTFINTVIPAFVMRGAPAVTEFRDDILFGEHEAAHGDGQGLA